MRKYILRNRHTLLLSVIACFFALVLLEANLTGRQLFSFEVDNSFFQFRVNESILGEDELQILSELGIDL
ncbi:MAG: hypothetical protein OXE54_06575 [Gammaproteobacteria bacterium]|nr:hypothetical protein [Gammaproteobacteria bacterium]MCY4296628.1 hypothetical protein [Gammaproteobacteria bacterium]